MLSTVYKLAKRLSQGGHLQGRFFIIAGSPYGTAQPNQWENFGYFGARRVKVISAKELMS